MSTKVKKKKAVCVCEVMTQCLSIHEDFLLPSHQIPQESSQILSPLFSKENEAKKV